tara:strand:+ start:270 stop:455 length:186 start_codon:yes stop_codon:yes gene_type:complete
METREGEGGEGGMLVKEIVCDINYEMLKHLCSKDNREGVNTLIGWMLEGQFGSLDEEMEEV